MLTNDAVNFYGTRTKLADALGINKSAISNWGTVVPKGRAYELEKITHGKLRVNPDFYPKQVKVA